MPTPSRTCTTTEIQKASRRRDRESSFSSWINSLGGRRPRYSGKLLPVAGIVEFCALTSWQASAMVRRRSSAECGWSTSAKVFCTYSPISEPDETSLGKTAWLNLFRRKTSIFTLLSHCCLGRANARKAEHPGRDLVSHSVGRPRPKASLAIGCAGMLLDGRQNVSATASALRPSSNETTGLDRARTAPRKARSSAVEALPRPPQV